MGIVCILGMVRNVLGGGSFGTCHESLRGEQNMDGSPNSGKEELWPRRLFRGHNSYNVPIIRPSSKENQGQSRVKRKVSSKVRINLLY